jgi:sodium/proline symporter
MKHDVLIVSWTFACYLLCLLVIGIIAYRKTSNLSDYILGGRRLGAWVAALSAGASDMSGWLLLGLPGYAYASGFQAFWLAAGLLAGTYLNWRIVAPRLRVYSQLADDSMTLPEFLNQRFLDGSNSIRFIAAFFTLLFFLFYTVSGLVASGKLFNAVFSIPYEWAIVIGMSAILVYTFIGGFLAVSWTDLFQGLLMFIVLLIVPILAVNQAGGFAVINEVIIQNKPQMFSLFMDDNGDAIGVITILSLLAWGLGYFGQPHILARFKAIASPSYIASARMIGVSWSGLSMLGAIMVGITGYVIFQNGAGLADAEQVFLLLVNQLFTPILAGICLAAVLAAIMSTADSQLLVSASVLTEDIYKKLAGRPVSDRHLVWTGRIAVVLLALLATWLARDPQSNVLKLVSYAWGGFGAAFGPTLILSLYWRRMNRWGALAGMLAGGLTVVVWKQLSGGIFDLYELLPGFIVSFCAIIIVSRFTAPPGKPVTERFDQMSCQFELP